jgi:hypothetical protein
MDEQTIQAQENDKKSKVNKSETYVKTCIDYARSYVRGFITVYIAWFLGLDVEDGFWTTYFKPLERFWSIKRAQKDISVMRQCTCRSKKSRKKCNCLVDENKLRLTERGWACMEDALVEFLKHEFNGVSIVKEYPQVVLVAPGFAYENGIDILNAVENYRNKYGHVTDEELKPDPILMVKKLSEVSELNRNDPKFMRTRIAIGYAARALVNKRKYSDEVETLPSRWLIPIIPYLINMGFKYDLDWEQKKGKGKRKPTLTLTAENIHLVFKINSGPQFIPRFIPKCRPKEGNCA